MDELAKGAKLGDYVVEKKLGAGGMGAVYLARHAGDGSEAALKVMHPSSALSDNLRKRFLREGRATLALRHPNIVRILASFEAEGVPVLAMEVLHGMSFGEYLGQKNKLPVAEVAEIFLRITSALGTAHALGLTHRDLKPDNVFLLDEAPFVKILDFGIAKLSKGAGLDETSALTQTGTLMGSPFYMSPEQAFGEKWIDHRSDIWSIGVMLHQALTGILVTSADSLQGVFAKLVKASFPRVDVCEPSAPKDIADLVDRMLKLEPDERPRDLREVYAVLERHANVANEATTLFAAAVAPLLFDEPSTNDPEKSKPLSAGAGSTVVMTPEEASGARPERPLPKTENPNPSPLAGLAGTMLLAPSPIQAARAVTAPLPVIQNIAAKAPSLPPQKTEIPWSIIVPIVVVIGAAIAIFLSLR